MPEYFRPWNKGDPVLNSERMAAMRSRKQQRIKNHKHQLKIREKENLNLVQNAVDNRKKQKRNKQKEVIEKKIGLSTVIRDNENNITFIKGMKKFGMNLKVASKFFSTKFKCWSYVTGEDEIIIQGSVRNELINILPIQFPTIEAELIEDIGDQFLI